MYLKRLEIKGFKSFAETTEMNLKPGINIVVGPNGCGKSNIVDAIRWVLGENNVRHIRGQRNEDIIFNGTDKKKSQGMAYVEIIVDNHDHLLPVDYTEVTVERKAFRSGESEFSLNKSKVRMKDITDLFTGTGLGKKGYSIINQGELEQVLNGQPIERRLMLEEASGIIRHRHKRDEVQKRLLITSNDILRLGDLLKELEIRKAEVGEKAAKASAYQELSQRYDQRERQVVSFEWMKINKDIKSRRNDLAIRKSQIDEIRKKTAEMEAALQQTEVIIQENNQQLNSLREQKYLHETKINNSQNEIRLGQEKIRNASERIASAENDSAKYLQMLNSLSLDMEATEAAFSQDQQQMEQKQQEFLKVKAEVQILEEAIHQCKEQFEAKRSEVFQRVQLETEAGNKIIANEEELKRAQDKNQRLSIQLEEIQSKIASGQTMDDELQEQITTLKQQEQEITLRLEELQGEKERLQQTSGELNRNYDRLRDEIQKISGKLAASRELQKNMAGYSSGVKAIAGRFRGDQKLHGFVGIIGELIDVKPGLEVAVETALNRGLENIVVESMNDAKDAINILKQQKMGRVTFLPLDVLKSQPLPDTLRAKLQKIPGVLGLGAELVQYEPRCKKAVDYLLGRVLIVDNMEVAIRIYKSLDFPGRIVTLEGELINTSGAITGGHRESIQPGVIQRKGEEKKLAGLLQELNKQLTDTAAAIEQQNKKLDDVEKVISQMKNNLLEHTLKLEMLSKQKDKVMAEYHQLKQLRESYLFQLDEINKEILHLQENQLVWQEEKRSLQDDSSRLTEELEGFKQKLETDTRNLEVAKERLNSYHEQLEMKRKELENSAKNIAQFEQVKASYQQSMLAASQLKERMEKETAAEQEAIAARQTTIEQLGSVLQQVSDQITWNLQSTDELKQKSELYRKELAPLQQQLIQAESNQRNIELNIARLETELDNMRKNWQEKWRELLIDEPMEIPYKSADIKNFIKEMEDLKFQMESLWPVDLTALDEYQEINVRYDFQKQQYQDLIQARDALQQLLQETEKIMTKDFAHFLLLANESFKTTFKEMFGGGEALLRLDAQDDKLEAGVEIEVKMPGKKMQSLELLSGGERALTCIAFIFALLGLRPAPFCLLDEIDASLDETNLLRLTNYLIKMSDKMQFIVITHRQATITAGENIYGVTMPEKGISSVLTLNLEEAENLAG